MMEMIKIRNAEIYVDMHFKNPHVYCSFEGYCNIEKEIEELKEKNKKLKKCVEFYAEKSHWGINKPSENSSIDPCDFDDRGGKLARLTLKEIEESK